MEIRKFEGQVSARALVADAISWDKRLLSNLESGVTWTSWTAWHCEGSLIFSKRSLLHVVMDLMDSMAL